MSLADPIVLLIGEAASGPEVAQLDLVCRFYGFRLVVTGVSGQAVSGLAGNGTDEARPVLVAVHAAALAQLPASACDSLLAAAGRHRLPVAVVGLTPDSNHDNLHRISGEAAFRVTDAGADCGLWVSATEPAQTGFELRGLGLSFGPGPASCFDYPAGLSAQVLARVGSSEAEGKPALLRLAHDQGDRYLLARTTNVGPGAAWQFQRACFGEIAPLFLLIRDAGGARCWQAPAALANLTIDDPWLNEPYGCLSFPGLLAEMQRERFHATIGFVPWNYDRSDPEVVKLFREHPAHLSLAIHGNNHDRYEFFRYEAKPGDQQRPKPLAQQAHNIRQAVARMAAFHQLTGLAFDRVMVFPHGVCPARTFSVLKQQGFWATSNYSNTPLGEQPPADPAVALRSANADWDGFPAVRRAYPEKYPEEAIAIDLFLGNPAMFMAHQDLFFDGIDAFNGYARRVNLRQPNVRWLGLGEISRLIHLVRWRDESHCEVRLLSQHARISNPRSTPVEFHLAKREPAPETVERVTFDGRETPWRAHAGEVQLTLSLPAGANGLLQIHYRPPTDPTPVEIRRSGFRNRVLRLIADFRDLTLSGSVVGRFLTKKYYRGGKKRPTLSSLASRVVPFRRKS